MEGNWSETATSSRILKGLKVALKHFVLDFEEPVKDKEPGFKKKE